MAFIPKYEFVIKNKSGVVYNFYLNEKQHIEYIVSNKNGKWKEKNIVIPEETENFYVEIDNKDNFHIISYHNGGKLYYSYYNFNDEKWVNNLIVKYPVEEQKIFYPVIKYVNNKIHIFYYLKQNKEKDKSYLLHINFNNEDYDTSHVTTVYSHSYINPFKIFINNEEIILLYTSVLDKFDQIFITKFNTSDKKWHEPIAITKSDDKKIYINGLLDNKNNLHITWSKYDDEYLVVKYLNFNIDKFNKEIGNLNPISLSEKSSCSFPTLCYFKDILWVMWAEVNKVASCYSTNMGKNWSSPFIHENTRNLDFKRYRYISNYNIEENDISCDFIFGSLYPDIQFLGFGGETNDEISTSK